MSAFPMTVLKQSGRATSVSGGKDYHLVLIQTADNRALYVERYGKAAQWGHGWKTQQFERADDGRKAYKKKYQQKLEGEYTHRLVDKTLTVSDEDGLRKILGHQYIAKIGKDNWAWLMPGADTTGMKDGEIDTEWVTNADGTSSKRQRDPKIFEPQPEPVEAVEEKINSNPQWGIWG